MLQRIPRDIINKLRPNNDLGFYEMNLFLLNCTIQDIDDLLQFLNLITWVQFENTECGGVTGDNGTCFTTNECKEIGGTADGSCASGFGVCCVLKVNICINMIIIIIIIVTLSMFASSCFIVASWKLGDNLLNFPRFRLIFLLVQLRLQDQLQLHLLHEQQLPSDLQHHWSVLHQH